MSLTVCWPVTGDDTKTVRIPLPVAGLAALRAQVEAAFAPALRGLDFVLTDTAKHIGEEDVGALADGATLVLTLQRDGALAAPARERVTFQPHPATLTMAGDYEYFAAQGRHPFVYALAEFVDNSLRATRANAPLPRAITVSIVVAGAGPAASGLVCIADNGCGMTKHELNDWAVMNYSMEERGAKPVEPEAPGRAAGGGGGAAAGAARFLSGDLSFFGVGSKNAAFFMGSSVKVVTRKAGEPYVHELTLGAADLEARYRAHEAVYEEDMVHRNPGDDSTLAPMERAFPAAGDWARAEAAPGAPTAFTRVVIGDLKPDVLAQLARDEGGQALCRELGHLYHYYLHGEGGNRGGKGADADAGDAGGAGAGGALPSGEPLPDIALQRLPAAGGGAAPVWRRRLAEVDDDLETRMLRAQRAELAFTLAVPDRGTVAGVLYYFPFENDRETVPAEDPSASCKPSASPFGRGGGGGAGLTQAAGPSQAAPARTQGAAGGTQFGARTAAPPGGADAGDASDEEDAAPPLAAPLFEAFWQGRLIPGARVDTLPFIEAVRQKRSAQAKDAVPDEAFARLRGALFFGPGFRVTRNKLLFRDNLPELLAAAVPGDRLLERRFREWVARCHATLDKSARYEAPADSRAQAALRAAQGEAVTAFERVTDGQRVVRAGDVVRISAKPGVVGRVAYFTVPQAVREEGAYPNGRVHVEPLPPEVHGAGGPLRHFSLRRVEGVLGEREVAEHAAREVGRLPAALRVEPMRFATGQALAFCAGDAVPETSVAVVSGGGQRLTRAFYGGEKHGVVVTQRLWRLPAEGAPLPGDAPLQPAGAEEGEREGEAGAEERPAAKRPRKGRKGSKRDQDENADPGEAPAAAAAGAGAEPAGCGAAPGGGAGAPAAAELVLSVDNKTPNKDAFQFARLCDGLRAAGHYALEYVASPPIPGQPPLRLVVPIVVGAGPPASLDVSGLGRAAAALKVLALGEALPPLRVMLSDAFGNPVPLGPGAGATGVRIFAALAAPEGAPLERCKELTVASEQELGDDCIVVSMLRVLGSKKAAAAGAGLSALSAAAAPAATHPSAGGAQRTASQQSLPCAELRLCFQLQGGEGGLAPQALALRVRAGAPAAVRLLPGGGWGGGEGVVQVDSGAEIPEMKLQAVDAWGNPTAPSDDLPFTLALRSQALAPSTQEVHVDALGCAHVAGLVAAVSTKGAEWSDLTVGVNCAAAGGAAVAPALAAALPLRDLELRLLVQPSALPASAQLLLAGHPLPLGGPSSGDEACVALLEGVEAGSQVKQLTLVLLDEAGNPASAEVAGRVTVSWHRGNRKIVWNGEPIRLPSLEAPHSVADVAEPWVRFQGAATTPLTLELGMEVRAVPAAPAHWAVSLLEQGASQSQPSADELGVVRCGQPFALEVEALDRFSNRCGGGAAGGLPAPEIVLEAEVPLRFDPGEWDRGWVAQGKEDVYAARLVMEGLPGPVRILARDAAGAGGASLLAEDCLTVNLQAGPPAALAFAGPSTLELGTRACLASLEVGVRDAAGNPAAAGEAFELALCASALAADGSGRAAKVSAAGSNKLKVGRGRFGATFKHVSLVADAPGTYAVRVQSGSRKVALSEGVLLVTMAPQNVVTDLRVGVPADMADGCAAGAAGRLLVLVDTENGEPLPDEALAAGLTLRVTPPGGAKDDAFVAALPPAEEGPLPREAGGAYVFALEELPAAGTYSVSAEYSEARPEVRAGLGRKECELRSATLQFEVLPGPAVTLAVEAPALPDRAAVTNGPSRKQRLLVRAAAAQLRDQHGNAAGAAGVRVRFRLAAAAGADVAGGARAPELHVAEGPEPVETDDRGRAFLGDVSVVEGTGAAPSGALDCELVCEALGLYPCSALPVEADAEGWAPCWRCPVLFSDDSARFAAVEALSERRAALAAQRAELAGRVDAAAAAAAAAAREHARLAKHAATRQRAAGGAAAPQTAADADARARAVRRAGADAEGAPPAVRQARFGPPRAASTAAVEAALRAGDPGVIGALAQLVTVDDERLGRVASYATRALLGVLVVEDTACRARLAAALASTKYPMPDVVALTHLATYRGPKSGEVPGFRGAGELARALARAACACADRPLPQPLPHQRAGADPAPGGPGPEDWPAGCLGYLANLVRPVRKGHRASVVFGLLSGVIVFETMEDACAYREHVTQRLRQPCPDLLTLDMGRLTSRGVIAGASFRPPPLEKADYAIGSNPEGGAGGAADAARQAEAMAELADALRAAEAAEAAAAEAAAEAEGEEERCRGPLEEAEEALREVDAVLAQQGAGGAGGGGGKAPGSGSKRGRGRQAQAEAGQPEAAPADEEEEAPAEAAPKAKPKKRRLAKG